MNLSKAVVSFTLAAVLAGFAFVSTPTDAAQTAEIEAKQAVTHYLNAVSSGNINEIMKYSKDERIPDETQRKEMLQRFLQKHPVKKFEVLSINYVNDENITVTLTGQFGDNTETQTLPLLKENNQWKVLIEDK
ncbi:uncharacterized protein DUF4878 [Tumebacillus sp. BK434]|uniref:DUF4878 domain-containing protein n=1 Tax=Tumebacillus sp. BK434 TaxID=2512169 RepID=UPI001043CDC8|nr:DUF4878 domain-containing protein [Tumebacillus sp. BK434]TCP57941.1 uncharacterized protein DUF4878 [Tumebacillus sp. BK434]